jgi:Flp pilus assembly protein TadD
MSGRGGSPPDDGRALLARAFELHQAGRLDDAEAAYGAYLARHPGDPTALNNAGALALRAGNAPLAVARFEQLAALLPDSAPARCNLGHALIGIGRAMDAVCHLERAIQLDPGFAVAFNYLGMAFERAGARPQAVHAYERALALDPRQAEAAANLGHLRNRSGDTAAARTAFARALAASPGLLVAKTGVAFAQALDGDLDGGRSVLEAHVAEKPALATFWMALATLRHWSGDLVGAEAAYRTAAALEPLDFEARIGIAGTLLGRGNFAEGWRAFEERPDGCLGPARQLAEVPLWDGQALTGTLLVHAEQGLGDVVQFARFIPDAAARVGRLVVVADGAWRPLAPLLRTLAGKPTVLDDAALVAKLPERPTARVSVLSLPWLLGITPQQLAGRTPYLAAPADRQATWRPRLASLRRPRIGLAWTALARGEQGYLGRHKSVPVGQLAPLLATPGVSLVSLQVDAERGPTTARLVDLTADLRDCGDTAALLGELDLVITVDTTVAHIAGALGKPVWLLDRFHSCWRWRLATDRSPWYPSLRIFRQHRFLDWSRPLAEAKAALDRWVAGGASGNP